MNMTDADADTKFLVTKLDRIFHMKDLRKIGRVDEQDFVEWGRRAARFSGLVFSEKMEKNWRNAWEAFVGVGYETKTLWIRKMIDFSKLSNKYEISKALNLMMLKCVDVNKDGKILLPEFTAFVKPLGVTDEDARTSFNIIDVNQNGALDEMEFAESLARYELDLERSVYDNAYGFWIEPIIDNTFLIAKLTRIFDMMDLQEHGRVGERDFLTWGRRAAGSAGVKFTDLMGKRWKNAWTAYIGPGFETKKAWIKKMINYRNTDGSMEIFKGINQSILKCVDIDGDGICSLSEFTAFVEPLGVSAQDAKMSFEIIDKDGNGILDQMEFAEALSRYYLDRERSVFENVFGVWKNRDTSHEDDLEDYDDDMDHDDIGEATTSEGGGSCCVVS